jgi:hypothetical protein
MMNCQEIDEVLACLPDERTLFFYFPGRYALVLLGLALGKTHSLRLIRDTPFSRLLTKPVIKSLIADAGGSFGLLQAILPDLASGDAYCSLFAVNSDCLGFTTTSSKRDVR